MGYSAGDIVEGTVFKITNFGAFLDMPDGKRGLVHISEISTTYVSDIRNHLKIGDRVKAKVVASTSDGRFDLSIKKLLVDQEPGAALKKKKKFELPEQEKKVVPGEQEKPLTPARQEKKISEHSSAALPALFEEQLTKILKNSQDRLAHLRKCL